MSLRVALGQLIRGEQHFRPGASLSLAGHVEGDAEDHQRVQHTGQEQRGQQPIADRGDAFAQSGKTSG